MIKTNFDDLLAPSRRTANTSRISPTSPGGRNLRAGVSRRAEQVQVSTSGGPKPFWRGDGKELFYRLGHRHGRAGPDDALLFGGQSNPALSGDVCLGHRYAATIVRRPDGQRFLAIARAWPRGSQACLHRAELDGRAAEVAARNGEGRTRVRALGVRRVDERGCASGGNAAPVGESRAGPNRPAAASTVPGTEGPKSCSSPRDECRPPTRGSRCWCRDGHSTWNMRNIGFDNHLPGIPKSPCTHAWAECRVLEREGPTENRRGVIRG